MRKCEETAQTLPDATLPIGKIHPFKKIATFLNQIFDFDIFLNFKCPEPVR